MADRTFRIQGAVGLKLAFRNAFELCKQLMQKDGTSYELVIRQLKSKRSIEQNKRYWSLLRELAAVAWVDGRQFDDQVWHEQFKRWFIGCEDVSLPDGSTELRGISTTKLTVDEFGIYMTKIEAWAAENGFPIGMEQAA
ncbi:recombination protein NinB [Pseudomonas aeruginosa]|uniref:recombination protein NinB n=1 Tax=Pseudomonas aeruginosa TaxID=287 RepID=UPI0028761F68|nr:recombination protein NinB [Pseudomonas aeruginosa]MDS1044660.1 recombination protein NinB [Pseudomonas aeruginosa]